MPRKLKELETAKKGAVESVAAFIRRRGPRRANSGPQKARVDKVTRQMNEMRVANEWAEATPMHLVALYTWCHEQTYGLRPVEFERGGLLWSAATACATKMLREEFKGDIDEMVDYMRWSWRREKRKEEWRRESNRDGGRIEWRAQFMHLYLLTDYRIDKARRK